MGANVGATQSVNVRDEGVAGLAGCSVAVGGGGVADAGGCGDEVGVAVQELITKLAIRDAIQRGLRFAFMLRLYSLKLNVSATYVLLRME